MGKRNILIVAVDGLRAGALGAYGNTTFGTPALDQFAADSFLLDLCIAPAADLDAVHRALWRSQQPLRPAEGNQAVTLPKILAEHGWETTLLTDDATIATSLDTVDFEHQLVVNSPEGSSANETRALHIPQTAIAQLFESTCNLMQTDSATGIRHEHANGGKPRLIWIHSQGMYGPWDAPLELQQELLDEGDPPPVEVVTPPDFRLPETHDPDVIFRYSCAYAAQIMSLDSCWNALMGAVEANKSEWLVVLIGLRGFPLGQHRRIGGVDYRMYGEQLHVPWLIRFPSGMGRLARSAALASHVNLLPTVLDWLEISMPQTAPIFDGSSVLPLVANPRASWRDVAIATSPTSRAIRTPEWCLRQDFGLGTGVSEAESSELYVRPDDRWEANDVAKLCPDVVESLTSRAAELTRQFSEPIRTA